MADLSGERLGPFEIRSLIGTGGFATVYRAHDPRLGTEVALKILAENHSLDPSIRERFLGEANALRRVDSSAVVRIYDIRETPDARPYLVLEFADRGDLVGRRRALTANGWIPNAVDVGSVVEGVAEALDAVHAEDLVHRDVTPSNLLIRSGRRTTSRPGVTLIEPDERFMLSDMGLVKDLSAGSSLTVGGGTAGFWAPEQQQAMASVDHRTDVYSASALLVWLLSGTTVTSSPTWDDGLRTAGWPPQLVTEMRRGLALDPADRHQSIREWEAAMVAALAGPATAVAFEAAEPIALAAAPQVPAPPLTDQSFAPAATSTPPAQAAVSPMPAAAPPGTATGLAPDAPATSPSTRSGVLVAGAALAVAALVGLLAFVLLRDNPDVASGEGGQTVEQTESTSGQTQDSTSSGGGGGADDADTSSGGAGSKSADEVDTSAGGQVGEPRTVDTWAIATHGNGSQLTVEQLSVSADRTTVAFVAINGRDFDTQFSADDRTTELMDSAGNRYALLEENQLSLSAGQVERFTLDFEPIPAGPAAITVAFNVRGDDEQTTAERLPGFSIEVDLTQPRLAPSLPSSVTIDDVDVHANSSTVRVTGLAFSDTNIAVGLIGTNGSGRRISFSAGHQASFLEDDLDNRYWLKFEDDERFIRVDEGFQVSGSLVFAGRIHPDASTLQLVLNHEESTTSDTTSTPKFELGPWSIDGTFVGAGSVEAIAVQDTRTHPNSVDIALQSLEFAPTVSRASLDVVNNRRISIYLNSCCDNSYLLDDLGNRYLLFAAGSNDDLRVATEEQFADTVTFLGAIDPAATSIQVILNDRNEGGLDDPDTSHPEFVFGPYDLVRGPSDLPLGFDPAEFGIASSWEIARAE